ncbi:hypothetical protein FQZ97_582520 [compost metagenome]
MVRDNHREAQKLLLLVEDRHEHIDVRKVHAAFIRVVEDDHVAGGYIVGEAIHDHVHRVRDSAKVQRYRFRLGENATLAIAQRHRVIQHIAYDRRTSGAHHGVGHVVNDGVERVLDDRKSDWINVSISHDKFSR